MIRERLVRFCNKPDRTVCRWDEQDLKLLQILCYKRMLSDDSFDFSIEGNELFMLHKGGIVGSYWTSSKNDFLAALLIALANKPVRFKRGSKHGNFIYVP